MTIPGLPKDKELEYYRLISKIESNDNPNAKAKTSSASGRFQFIKTTWEGLGYKWADVFNDAKQWEAIEKFTAQNAKQLQAAGCAINFATLYGAHFLGTAGFLRIMRALPSDPIAAHTTEGARKANPTILRGTVKDFTDWLEKKTGDDYRTRYTVTAEPSRPIPTGPEPAPTRPAIGAVVGFAALVAIVIFVIYIMGV